MRAGRKVVRRGDQLVDRRTLAQFKQHCVVSRQHYLFRLRSPSIPVAAGTNSQGAWWPPHVCPVVVADANQAVVPSILSCSQLPFHVQVGANTKSHGAAAILCSTCKLFTNSSLLAAPAFTYCVFVFVGPHASLEVAVEKRILETQQLPGRFSQTSSSGPIVSLPEQPPDWPLPLLAAKIPHLANQTHFFLPFLHPTNALVRPQLPTHATRPQTYLDS